MALYRVKSDENYYKIIEIKSKTVVAVFSKKQEVQKFLKALLQEIENQDLFLFPEKVVPTYLDKKLHLFQEENNKLYLESKKEKEIKLRSFFTFKDERPVEYQIPIKNNRKINNYEENPDISVETIEEQINDSVIDLGPEDLSTNDEFVDYGPENGEDVFINVRDDEDGLGDYMVNIYSKKELKEMKKEQKKELKYQRKHGNVW